MDTLYMRAPEEYAIAKAVGVPLKTTEIDTACVTYNPDKKNISFFFNVDFANRISDDGLAFVFAHESRHVFLNHLKEKMSGDYPRDDVLTIAQECIINDYLEEKTLLEPPGEDHITGKGTFGTSFADFTTREGYDFIINHLEKQDGENGEESSNSSTKGQNSQASSSTSGNSQEEGEGESCPEDDNGNVTSGGKGDGHQEENTDSPSQESGDPTDPNTDSDSTDDSDANEDTSGGNASEEDGKNSQSEKMIEDILESLHFSGTHVGEKSNNGEDNSSGNSQDNVSSEDISKALQDVFSEIANVINQENISVNDDMLNDIASELSSSKGKTKQNTASHPVFGRGNSKDMKAMSADDIIDDSVEIAWAEYLAKINPDILTAGSARQDEYVWVKQNRKLIDSYPGVIIPGVIDDEEDLDEGGESIPTVILALDFSFSIPREFIGKLASMAESVPDKFIRVLPVTWSDTVKEFDVEERKIISHGGTNIAAVWHYSQWVADTQLNGEQPYVLVISDGGFRFSTSWSDYFGLYSAREENEYSPYEGIDPQDTPDAEVLKKYWNIALINYYQDLSQLLMYNGDYTYGMSRDDLKDIAMDVESLI